MIVKPKDASTVILLREGTGPGEDGAFEVLMVRRHPDNAFVPDSYVFPGGALDESDCSRDVDGFCHGLDRRKAESILDEVTAPDRALGAWVAAIRETFEEVGILLTYNSEEQLIDFRSPETARRFSSYRQALADGSKSFLEIISEENLILATDSLHYFSHWITPWFLPIRYDVRFFVARAPEHQEPLHDGFELTDNVWMTPKAILADNRLRRFDMVEPTLITIRELARFRNIDEVIASTEGKKVSSRS